MISSSVTTDRHRILSGPKVAPAISRESLRQIETIFREDALQDDVEAPEHNGNAGSSSPPKVLRSARRRLTSKYTARNSIMRILKDQKEGTGQSVLHFRADTLLSPFDWLMGPVNDEILLENIHDEWEQKQEIENISLPWYILSPQNKFRLGWDLFMAWLLSIMAYYIPFRVCFYWDAVVEDESIFIFESSIDAAFAFDILLNFFTAYNDHKTSVLVTRPTLIALRYLKGSFLWI